ncbi:MAG: epoxyqueuosine reductase [Prolixibacteraceae bacterium]|nr:epoxyqueuosine reductase [Prolixibacteraceae bacterium]
MNLQKEIEAELKSRGADFVYFADISALPVQQNKNFPAAILIAKILSKEYLAEITSHPNYVQEKIKTKIVQTDEFEHSEKFTDALADFTAGFIAKKGFAAYSQSENNIANSGFYDFENKRTPLPHKTIALLAGLGWIGKHNLLVTREFGSALSMCTVLTDAPLKTAAYRLTKSKCGNCRVCIDVCTCAAILGKNWEPGLQREEIINVTRCTTCLRCLVFCPWTQKYMVRKSENIT